MDLFSKISEGKSFFGTHFLSPSILLICSSFMVDVTATLLNYIPDVFSTATLLNYIPDVFFTATLLNYIQGGFFPATLLNYIFGHSSSNPV